MGIFRSGKNQGKSTVGSGTPPANAVIAAHTATSSPPATPYRIILRGRGVNVLETSFVSLRSTGITTTEFVGSVRAPTNLGSGAYDHAELWIGYHTRLAENSFAHALHLAGGGTVNLVFSVQHPMGSFPEAQDRVPALPTPPKFESIEEAERWLEEHA